MTDMGLCQHYLCIKVTQDYTWGLIYLLLSTYIKKILRQFGLDGYHSLFIAIDWRKYLKLEQSNTDLDSEILEQYQLAIDVLL